MASRSSRVLSAEEVSKRRIKGVRDVLLANGFPATCRTASTNEKGVEVWSVLSGIVYLRSALRGTWHVRANWTFRNDPAGLADAFLERSSIGLNVTVNDQAIAADDSDAQCLFRYDFDARRPVRLHVHAQLPPKQRSGTHWPVHLHAAAVGADTEWAFADLLGFFNSKDMWDDLRADGWALA